MTLHCGDCLEVMAGLEPESVDAIVTDPPYGIRFMGKAWDGAAIVEATRRRNAPNVGRTFTASDGSVRRKDTQPYAGISAEAGAYDFSLRGNAAFQSWCRDWAEAAYRVAKPSAYLLAFGGTRTVHRLTSAIEDAGWIIRDMLVWAYASGFPKGRANLKPAWEPIVMARKPGPLRMLAIDECRIPAAPGDKAVFPAGVMSDTERVFGGGDGMYGDRQRPLDGSPLGRWPANVILGDALFEPGVPGVVIGGSLTGTMTAWSSSPDSEPSPTASTAKRAAARLSRGVPGGNSPASATEPVGMQLDAWGTSTDTSKTDIGCSDGMTAGDDAISGSTGRSGRTLTATSRGATSSTTGTATDSTTDSTISNASAEPSTTRITSPSEPGSTEWRDLASLSDDAANWRRNSSRAGEPSADRRYSDRGGTDFAPLPGERRDVDGLGYSRFFLIPKADRADREPVLGGLPQQTPQGPIRRANHHPTVKPVDLMRHLVRLVTPTGGTVLDPFGGSGSTALAAEMEGFPWILIEKELEYVAIAEARLNGTQRGLGLPA